MSSVREVVTAALARGDLDAHSLLTDVHGIGPYLAARIARAFAGASTVGDVWNATRTRARVTVERAARRAVQNERANRCVATRVAGSRARTYHVGDLNERGYEALATLLNHAPPPTTYGALPTRLPRRAPSSKECGCLGVRACDASPRCVRSDDGRRCVPRAHNATGFDGVPGHQRETDATRVRRATRRATAHRGDPDVRRDLRNGNARRLSYDRRGALRWRRPGSRVRVPLT